MERHLADMFAVSVSTVSRIYMTWVRFLALTFNGSLLRWPSKQEIKTHMPNSFSKYPGTRVIIDCTEFFIEKISFPSAQKATWSDYKHHNTVKLLIGLCAFFENFCCITLLLPVLYHAPTEIALVFSLVAVGSN